MVEKVRALHLGAPHSFVHSFIQETGKGLLCFIPKQLCSKAALYPVVQFLAGLPSDARVDPLLLNK